MRLFYDGSASWKSWCGSLVMLILRISYLVTMFTLRSNEWHVTKVTYWIIFCTLSLLTSFFMGPQLDPTLRNTSQAPCVMLLLYYLKCTPGSLFMIKMISSNRYDPNSKPKCVYEYQWPANPDARLQYNSLDHNSALLHFTLTAVYHCNALWPYPYHLTPL